MTWLLIDGNNLAKRCRHSQAYLTTTQGKASGTISGFLLGVMHAANKARVPRNQVIVCWDGGRAKWRKDLCPEYKAHRKKDDIEDEEHKQYVRQLIDLQDLLEATCVRQIRIHGVEADDIIGHLAYNVFTEETVIYSTDDDFLQFYEPSGRIKILHPKKGFVDDAYMLKKFNFADGKDVVLYKAIVGDSSDNIKGVHGIGPKRASMILPFLRVAMDAERVGVDTVNAPVDSRAWKYATKAQQAETVIVRNIKMIDLKGSFETQHLAALHQRRTVPLKQDSETAYRIIRNYELVDIGSRFMEW